MTYYEIIELNRLFADAHNDIKNFGVGGDFDMVLSDQENPYRYPLIWLEDLPSPIQNGLEGFSFRVYCLGQVEQLEHREGDLISTNRNQVISDMRLVAIDFLSYWKQNTVYKDLRFSVTTNITPKENFTPDDLFGVEFDVQFQFEQTFNKCIIPMSGIPSPESQDVFVYGNDTLMVTISNGVYEFEIKDTDGNLVGTWNPILKLWTVPSSGGGGSIDIAVNGTPFYLGVSTNQDLPVKKSDGATNVGSKIGADWIIGDTSETFNGAAITGVTAEGFKDITVVNSTFTQIGTKTIDTEAELEIAIPDVIMPIYVSPDLVTPVANITIIAGVIPNFTIDC